MQGLFYAEIYCVGLCLVHGVVGPAVGGGGTGGIHISAVAPHSNGHITGPLHIHSTIGAFHRHGLTVLGYCQGFVTKLDNKFQCVNR